MANTKRNFKYKNCSSEDGTFSCKLKKDTNTKLDIYCEMNNLNKTKLVNELVEREMQQKFSRLKDNED